MNKGCKYYGITDASVHALVGCGGHGQRERIQDLKCQACKKKMTERCNTAFALGAVERSVAKLRELDPGQVLNTTFVERVNLTLRQGVPALARRTWSTAQERGQLILLPDRK